MKKILILLIISLQARAQYTSADIVLIIGYGQSNAVGVAPQYISGADLAPSPYNVTKLERDNATEVLSFFHSQQYQTSVNEPTYERDRVSILPMLGDLMAQYLIDQGINAEVLTISAAVNGAGIVSIYKNTSYYNYLLRCLDSARAYADRKGKNLRCAYVAFLHGETDATANFGSYTAYLTGLADYLNADIKSKTGQSEDIKVILSQLGFSYWSDLSGSYPARTMNICNAMISGLSNSKIRIATPGYIAPLEGNEFYSKNFQSSHYGGRGLALLAPYFQHCWEETTWPSFTCTSAILSGNEITITLTPLTGSVQLDATRICKNNQYGFEFTSSGWPAVTISSVAVLNSTQIKITLSGIPTGTNTLYYTYSMNYPVSGLQYYRQNGAVKDGDNNYLNAFSKVL